ncbi:zinc metalloprotease HtpX [Azospirillum rugosum]|uniref:Heat shock protein HtpX n=1 Tax=Azospirillum rugosum TaxID=416170 RepID=A0ABS4SD85_9PROT|nr:zinc metalloprotease HtpX [Azospirillum rugosum]MBP2290519.1 heat shock protein HtpX [Azospirillum rugosum]MDQ0525407.1 heat shock protein HtpX [Azospirillum rugosum]
MAFASTDGAVAGLRRRHKIGNLVQSLLLLCGMVLMLALCGWILAGADGLVWALVGGGVSLLLSPRLSPRVILGMFGARRLSYADAPRLFETVGAIARRAGLPAPPELWYIASPTLNAFAVGRRRQSAIAVTDGLLRSLDLRELAGVLAHEISHIRNNDLAVMGLADTVTNLTRLMSLFGIALLIVNLPLLVMQPEAMPWLLILLLIAAPWGGALMQLALARTREFDADLDAAHLTGDPEGIATALARIDGLQRGPWEGIRFPGRRAQAIPSLLRTHPHTEERVRRLMELGAGRRTPQPAFPGLDRTPLPLVLPRAVRRPRYRLGGYWY